MPVPVAERPEPEGVTARELQWPPSVAQGCHEAAAEAGPGSPMQQLLVAAGDLLENYARRTIEPVPVSERLPGEGDCAQWADDLNATQWAWAARCVDDRWEWTQLSMLGLNSDNFRFRIIAGGGYTHWLPHHALPVPGAEVAPLNRGSESSLAEFNDGEMPLANSTPPLSPAAQAAWDAYKSGGLETALIAAADQVVPEDLKEPRGTGFRWGGWAAKQGVRRRLLALAAELRQEEQA